MSLQKPVKVLVVIASLEMGGAQRLVVDLLSHLDRRRVQPMLALSKRVGPFTDRVPSDCPVYDLGRRSNLDFPFLVARLARIIRREQPSVLFSLLFHGNILALAARHLSRIRVPIVISEHISVQSYNRGPALPRQIIRSCYPMADRVVAVSAGVGQELVDHWGVNSGRISVIHNPVDLDLIRKLAAETPDQSVDFSRPVIISVGRFTVQKGFSYLIRAFAQVRREIPATLVLVGDGEERSRLEALAADLGVGKYVTWIGLDTNPYRWLRRATVFVLSSLYEGFGTTVVEAMALGLPTVATDCSHGPAEILREGRDGMLVPPGDERALAIALLKVLGDKAMRLSLGVLGQRRAEDFSIRRIIGTYEALFESEALGEGGEAVI